MEHQACFAAAIKVSGSRLEGEMDIKSEYREVSGTESPYVRARLCLEKPGIDAAGVSWNYVHGHALFLAPANPEVAFCCPVAHRVDVTVSERNAEKVACPWCDRSVPLAACEFTSVLHEGERVYRYRQLFAICPSCSKVTKVAEGVHDGTMWLAIAFGLTPETPPLPTGA